MYRIVEQGTKVVAPNGDIIFNRPIKTKDLTTLFKNLSDTDIETAPYLLADGRHHVAQKHQSRKKNATPIEYLINDGVFHPAIAGKSINKVGIKVNNQPDAEKLQELLSGKLGGTYHVKITDENLVEVFHREGTKAHSALFLSNYLFGNDILLEQSANIGDGDNDSELAELMNERGGTSIAMGNGTKALKDASQFITSDVNKGGLEQALKAIKQLNAKFTN